VTIRGGTDDGDDGPEPADFRARAVMAPVLPDGWSPALPLAELPPGRAEVVYAFDDQIAVFHTVDGDLYALSNRCSHSRGPLADGTVEGCVVTCPFHEGRFDLRTGKALQEPAIVDVPAYEVRAVDGELQLRPRAAKSEPLPDVVAPAPAP
jgi:3-phenylpropionate/trans-cinnamate dioxygenase ferredoxin subunit